jgi:hypothetical protein
MKSREIDSIIVYGVFDFDEIQEVIEKSGYKISEEMKNLKELIPLMIFKPIKRLMKKYSVPVIFSGCFPYNYTWSKMFLDNEIPFFTMWDDPPKNLAILTQYAEFRSRYFKESQL